MTSKVEANDIWVVGVGSDHGLWYRYDSSGSAEKRAEAPWGGKGTVVYEPFTTHLWDGVVQVYYVNASNGHLMAKSASTKNLGDASSGIYDLGGVLAGSPIGVYYDEGNKRVHVFGVALDGQVWYCYYSNKWSWGKLPVTSLDPVAFQPDKIYASTDGKRRMDVVAVSVDNHLYHRYFNGTQWSAWAAVGMNAVGSRPLCWTPSSDRVDIVCKDARDNLLAHTANDTGVWLGWQKIGGDVTVHFDQAASYCTESPTRYHLGAISKVGGNGLISLFNYEKGKLGTWSDFTNLGGVFGSTPKIAHRKGQPIFFGKGMDSSYYFRAQTGTTWGSFMKLPGTYITKPC